MLARSRDWLREWRYHGGVLRRHGLSGSSRLGASRLRRTIPWWDDNRRPHVRRARLTNRRGGRPYRLDPQRPGGPSLAGGMGHHRCALLATRRRRRDVLEPYPRILEIGRASGRGRRGAVGEG